MGHDERRAVRCRGDAVHVELAAGVRRRAAQGQRPRRAQGGPGPNQHQVQLGLPAVREPGAPGGGATSLMDVPAAESPSW